MPYVQRYTDDDLLAELQRVAAIVPRHLTLAAFDAHSPIVPVTMLRRFGSWRAALSAAGLEGRSARRSPATRKVRRRRVRYSDEELIAELQAVSRRIGSQTINQYDVRDHSDLIGVGVLIARFGSFAAACERAGLRLSKMANRWTNEELAANLSRITEELGRRPILADLGRPPSRISAKTYTYRYGSWAAAIEALAAMYPNMLREAS